MDKQILFKTGEITGEFHLPYSKSVSNRMLLMNAFAGRAADDGHFSDCDDTRVMREALAGDLSVVDVGDAGTAMRFLAAYLATVPGAHVLTGSPRMCRRPIGGLVDALRQLGAEVDYLGEEGFPPLRVVGGPLQGGNVVVEASVSSQFLSALMMLGACVRGGVRLQLKGEPVSFPYVRMTAELMRRCGGRLRVAHGAILVQDTGYPVAADVYEHDWSSASYFYELLAVAKRGAVTLPGLRYHCLQGDRAQMRLWERLGVHTVRSWKGFRLSYAPVYCDYFEADFTDMPDVSLSFIVACCLRGVPFWISGLRTLRGKECDRREALVAELGKLGYPLRVRGEGVVFWDGTRTEPSSLVVDPHGDHRMAMAFAAAGLLFPRLVIRDAEVVGKSYPGFWAQLEPLLA